MVTTLFDNSEWSSRFACIQQRADNRLQGWNCLRAKCRIKSSTAGLQFCSPDSEENWKGMKNARQSLSDVCEMVIMRKKRRRRRRKRRRRRRKRRRSERKRRGEEKETLIMIIIINNSNTNSDH